MAKIGILAVQGDFEKHQQIVNSLGHETLLVKTQEELAASDALIIPGGESTTLTKLFTKHNLEKALVDYAGKKPVFGTCAGLIVLSKKVINHPVETLGLINVTAARNAYGRQVDSFIDDIEINFGNEAFSYEGVFIRAPKIIEIGENVKVLGKHKDDIVLAQSGNVLVATFHPELTDDARVHQYFIERIGSFE